MAKKTQTEAEKKAAKERADKLAKSHVQAMTTLQANHLSEYNTLRQEAAQALGVEWVPPLTKEQKAALDLEEIYSEFPHLRPGANEE